MASDGGSVDETDAAFFNDSAGTHAVAHHLNNEETCATLKIFKSESFAVLDIRLKLVFIIDGLGGI